MMSVSGPPHEVQYLRDLVWRGVADGEGYKAERAQHLLQEG